MGGCNAHFSREFARLRDNVTIMLTTADLRTSGLVFSARWELKITSVMRGKLFTRCGVRQQSCLPYNCQPYPRPERRIAVSAAPPVSQTPWGVSGPLRTFLLRCQGRVLRLNIRR